MGDPVVGHDFHPTKLDVGRVDFLAKQLIES